MSAKIGIRDLRNHFPKVRHLLEAEGEVLLTEKGRPRYRLTLYSPADEDAALGALEDDFAQGRYKQADLPWRAALRRATDLSRKHTSTVGCRSLDVLHVASAIELQFKRFTTFDSRQQQLTKAAGLKLVTPAV
jgi:antitoxin (DNA-binding transcriptional repressor) of toxin-antitoxin stability system